MAFFNYQEARTLIEEAAAYYAKTAPQLVEWLDETYINLAENPAAVSVYELMQLQRLRQEDGTWEHPNYAQNRWYKLRATQGKPNGVLSY